jgi:hypothetical protein
MPLQESDAITYRMIERAARALNDEWAAGSQGAKWWSLEPEERERWLDAARVALKAALRV